ncbi:MAG TPA: hypothetical protein VIG71_10860 [Enteractinococcus sp.]
MENLATSEAQIVEPNYSEVSQLEQKIFGIADLAAYIEMDLQADRDDEHFYHLDEENQYESLGS